MDHHEHTPATGRCCLVCGRPLSHPGGVTCPRGTPPPAGQIRQCHNEHRSVERAKKRGTEAQLALVTSKTQAALRNSEPIPEQPVALLPFLERDDIVRLVGRLRLPGDASTGQLHQICQEAAAVIEDFNPVNVIVRLEQHQFEVGQQRERLRRELEDRSAQLAERDQRILALNEQLERADADALLDEAEALCAYIRELQAQIAALEGELQQARNEAARHHQEQVQTELAVAQERWTEQAQAAEANAVANAVTATAASMEAEHADALRIREEELRREAHERLEAVTARLIAAQQETLEALRSAHDQSLSLLQNQLDTATVQIEQLMRLLPQLAAPPSDGTAAASNGTDNRAPNGPAARARTARPAPKRAFAAEPDPAQPQPVTL